MLDKLNITVQGTRFTGDGKVYIDFRGSNEERNINLNGYIPDVDERDYFENAKSVKDIETFVRREVVSLLSADSEATEEDSSANEGEGEAEVQATAQTANTEDTTESDGGTRSFQVAGNSANRGRNNK